MKRQTEFAEAEPVTFRSRQSHIPNEQNKEFWGVSARLMVHISSNKAPGIAAETDSNSEAAPVTVRYRQTHIPNEPNKVFLGVLFSV